MSRVEALNLVNFTGGLNLRADAFELGETESPDMLNVDIDPRGGFFSRKGWERWNSTAIGSPWDPRSMFVHTLANGTDYVFLSNDGGLLQSTNGSFSAVQVSSVDVTVGADPHLADFASWGDTLYVACGNQQQVLEWTSSSTSLLTAAGSSSFTDYTSPSTDVFPQCDFVAAHSGFVFAAGTYEDSNAHPHRLRWSHPAVPVAWNADDYIDIKEGGGPITGILPMRDHLLIFKPSSVWALFGYDSSSWQLVNVTREVGAVNRQAIARSEQTAFFFAWPRGVFAITDTQYPVEISQQLRPAFEDSYFANSASDEMWMGWLKDRLWVSVPFLNDGSGSPPSTAKTSFVFDPSLGDNGAWTAYLGTGDEGVGPFAQGGNYGASDNRAFAACRETAAVVRVDELDNAFDDLDGSSSAFDTRYVTRWVDAGWPSLRKSWRSPDMILEQKSAEYELGIKVFRDFDGSSAKRQRSVTVGSTSTAGVWGTMYWGTGVYGTGGSGTTLERGPSFGPASSVQLMFEGEDLKSWGVNGLVLKYIPRRLR